MTRERKCMYVATCGDDCLMVQLDQESNAASSLQVTNLDGRQVAFSTYLFDPGWSAVKLFLFTCSVSGQVSMRRQTLRTEKIVFHGGTICFAVLLFIYSINISAGIAKYMRMAAQTGCCCLLLPTTSTDRCRVRSRRIL
ncbi:unnamed protein product [Ectocarpus sp. 12 AP-2014]